VLRRVREGGGGGGGEVIVAGPICVDLARHEVRRHGRPVALTRKEFELLAFLVRHAGRALTREQLLDNVWGEDYFGDNRIVDVHIRHLREKLEDDAARPTIIRTVRGVGYRFEDRSPEEG
ncbi:MAG: response regulator transcription factor, partial [Clostridia bacterium]|nr:response regulator transcription factor [Clostridia bacterium]